MYCDVVILCFFCVFFFKQKTAYEMRISDWSSDVCSSDLLLSASSAGVTVVAIIAPERNIASFHGRPIVPDLAAARTLKAEAVAIADSQQPQTVYDSLRRDLPTDRIVTPRLLHAAIARPADREDAA